MPALLEWSENNASFRLNKPLFPTLKKRKKSWRLLQNSCQFWRKNQFVFRQFYKTSPFFS